MNSRLFLSCNRMVKAKAFILCRYELMKCEAGLQTPQAWAPAALLHPSTASCRVWYAQHGSRECSLSQVLDPLGRILDSSPCAHTLEPSTHTRRPQDVVDQCLRKPNVGCNFRYIPNHCSRTQKNLFATRARVRYYCINECMSKPVSLRAALR